jgi:hypothetical protein
MRPTTEKNGNTGGRASRRQVLILLGLAALNVVIGMGGVVLIVFGQTILGIVLLLASTAEAYLTIRWSVRNHVRWPFE